MAPIILSNAIFSSMLLLTMAWDFSHNLNVSRKHSVVQRSPNINYSTIFNFWQNHKSELIVHSEHKEVVMVMGNTGAGKSTLVSALTGRKLKSIMSKGYRVIVDEENRIGTGVSSKTLIPEIITDKKRNMTYVDCSGFRDNRNVEYEISSIYFQNILMNQIKIIKFMFVINYDSLKDNGNKNDFDDLLEHIGEFIKDMSKFHDGIALVATKVENMYDMSDYGTVFLVNDDETVLRGIADYLQKKKEIYRSKTDDPEKYKTFVNLIEVLLQKKDGIYTRISLFRQPVGQGLLENLPKTRNEINAIAKMITENLQYVEKKTGDFGFALSKSSKNIVDQIVDDIFRNALMNRLHKIGNKILTYYSQLVEQYKDIGILRERVSYAYDVISTVKNVDEPQDLFQEFLNAVNSLHITISLTALKIISDDIKALQFFTTVSNSYKDIHMMLLENEIQNVMKLVENLKDFYDFLDNLQINLAAYKSQELKSNHRIANIMTSCRGLKYKTVQNIKDLENIVKKIGSDHIFQKIRKLKLNQFQLKHLTAVFSAFSSKLESSCLASSEQMIVKGYNVKMSDVVEIDCWTQAKNIQIFALNKVFIDCTINKTGTEVQLFIFAPTWEIEDEQKIILNGKLGKPHDSASAKSSFSNTENGSNGLPGLPGGPAGNFFGFGRRFINSEQLEIHANGGDGGPGQHGGNGADGIAGENVPESFFHIYLQMDNEASRFKNYLNKRNFEYHIHPIEHIYFLSTKFQVYGHIYGKPAKKPTDGGNGGVGGIGGYPGRIVIGSLGKSVNVKVSNHSGLTGLSNRGGRGGDETLDGRSVEFEYYDFYGLASLFAQPIYTSINWIRGAIVPAGDDGKPGSNKNNQIYPPKLSLVSPYLVINSFKNFVRMNLFENIKELELQTFIHELENDNRIKTEYNTLAFVEEFKGLENQFLKLRNKIVFIPFYDSFLVRVEEFSKSEKILENKKVLSYIYTAALTKVLTLKEKTESKTVVNLSKYLNTMEMSIKEIRETQNLQIVQNYRDNYENSLRNKIREANDFIEKIIEPEINRLSQELDNQIKIITDEIEINKNSTNHAIELLEKNRAKIRDTILFSSMLLPLKLATSALSFLGPIGAEISTLITNSATIAEGMHVNTTYGQEENTIYSVEPNLKSIPRVIEVYDNKPQQLVDKFTVVIETLETYKEELSLTEEEKNVFSHMIKEWKMQLNGIENWKASTIADVDNKTRDMENIEKQINEFIFSRNDILGKEKRQFNVTKIEEENSEILEKKRKMEKSLRAINHMQSILKSFAIVSNFAKRLGNNEETITSINYQISEYVDQIRDLETLETQVYNTVIPDFGHIEETINAITTSIDGWSHAKSDLTKWTVRSTLKDVKSLLKKFTYKMSFELQNNLKRYMDKIDEGFSILIDIYDRIDSYSESVKQAEYMAHIVSMPMRDITVPNSELNDAIIDSKLIIQSNIFFEKYRTILDLFKQHYFPFAAHVLQKFQLPTDMQFNDIETLKSNIIEKIRDMKNHIDESDAIVGKYSKFIHDNNVFNSNTIGSTPFYVWKHDTIKDEIKKLLNGSEVLIKADISNGVYYNAVKYSDIGINFNFNNKNLQNNFTAVLENFALTMTMVGKNYYRCGERYYSVSFDDDITISYTLTKDEEKNWINSNLVYTAIHSSQPFFSPYGMWIIKLASVNEFVSFDDLNVYANEAIDLELIGRGYYFEQNPGFNFEICNEYLDTFYNVENIETELV